MNSTATGFELAVRVYSSDLYRYAYWLCGHAQQAEDLVQEALLRAWKSWDRIEDVNATKYWLFTIVRREFLRRLAKDKQMPTESWDEQDLASLPDTKLNSEDSLELRQLLLKVPVNMREPLVLQVLGGFSCNEIASLLSISEGAVNTRLTRARQWLKNLLVFDSSSDKSPNIIPRNKRSTLHDN